MCLALGALMVHATVMGGAEVTLGDPGSGEPRVVRSQSSPAMAISFSRAEEGVWSLGAEEMIESWWGELMSELLSLMSEPSC